METAHDGGNLSGFTKSKEFTQVNKKKVKPNGKLCSHISVGSNFAVIIASSDAYVILGNMYFCACVRNGNNNIKNRSLAPAIRTTL